MVNPEGLSEGGAKRKGGRKGEDRGRYFTKESLGGGRKRFLEKRPQFRKEGKSRGCAW